MTYIKEDLKFKEHVRFVYTCLISMQYLLLYLYNYIHVIYMCIHPYNV